MKKVDVHRAWARPEGRWSAWVKPVLFASLDDDLEPQPLGPPPSWLVPCVLAPLDTAAGGESYRRPRDPFADTAMVVDLPGAEGALAGIALAAHGFAPIPLYNAMWAEAAVVDTGPILDALVDGAPVVRDVPDTAPPAFLLDADRHGRGRPIRGGDLDNRSFAMPTDLPSADTLWSAGVRRAVLIQRRASWPEADLAAALLAWQRRGIALLLARTDPSSPVAPLTSVRPPWRVRVADRIDRLFFERRADGGFGGLVPPPPPAAG
jgi:hypothetical protein